MMKYIYAPWPIILWRAIWYIPVQLFRVALCIMTWVGWGPNTAARMWRDTK